MLMMTSESDDEITIVVCDGYLELLSVWGTRGTVQKVYSLNWSVRNGGDGERALKFGMQKWEGIVRVTGVGLYGRVLQMTFEKLCFAGGCRATADVLRTINESLQEAQWDSKKIARTFVIAGRWDFNNRLFPSDDELAEDVFNKCVCGVAGFLEDIAEFFSTAQVWYVHSKMKL